MATTSAAPGTGKLTKLEVRNPSTNELLATLPVHKAEDVNAAVVRARRAFEVWAALSFGERRAHLLDYRREIVRRMDDFLNIVQRENGKPKNDVASELLLVTSHLTHAANRAEHVFRSRRVSSGMLPTFRSTVSYHPLGVIGVIGPWNYPLFTPMGSIAYALAAGNAVVFKPSEYTPLSGKLLVECAQAAIPVPDLVQLITGYGETGSALARAKVDKLAFTGSPATGRRVMAAAAENLTPVLMELGGKDAMIVAADADVKRAASAAVFGAFTNSGQACISIERVYVADSVYQPFVDEVVALARSIRVGTGEDAHYGAMTMEKQIDIVREHLKDALDKGAKALIGGLDSIKGRFIDPVVLVDVTPDMKVMSEETFGPILPIARVSTGDEAVRLANEGKYGLGSSVFAKKDGQRLAAAVRSGMTSINSVIAFAGIPALPFGGVGDSGFGRIHGDEGMREFARIKATAEEMMPMPGFSLSFGDPGKSLEQTRSVLKRVYGGSMLDDVRGAFGRIFRR
jgi:aldehyde dehydrogenase (NAD+)